MQEIQKEQSLSDKNVKFEAACLNEPGSGRLMSLDALRGFDMLWIVGGDQLVRNADKYFDWPPLQWLAGQMYHPSWEGFSAYDLIFPLFLFIVGVTIPFSLQSKLENGVPKWKIYLRISRRLLLLLLLGVVYNGGLKLTGFESTRFGSVLGFIGIGYFFAALIVMNFRIKGQVLWFIGILLGYWAVVEWIPVPNYGAGVITPEGSLATYIDQLMMPGRFHFKIYDPQGILPCISGICTALAGALTGSFLQKRDISKLAKAVGLLIAGIFCIILGRFWNNYFPIIKNLWSGSFVILTTGWSLLLLTLFYLIIDVMGFKKLAFVFVVVGMNPITIYLAHKMINFTYTSNFLFGGLIKQTSENLQPALFSVVFLFVEWLFLYVLYRKKIFLKI